jgi:hypothetical protein
MELFRLNTHSILGLLHGLSAMLSFRTRVQITHKEGLHTTKCTDTKQIQKNIRVSYFQGNLLHPSTG